MTDVTELKPCPFCGDSADLSLYGVGATVICTNCNAQTPMLFDEETVVELWNTRALDPSLAGSGDAVAVAIACAMGRFPDDESVKLAARAAIAALRPVSNGGQG